MSQREILRAARRAQAKLANREKPRAKRQPCAKRGTNLRVSSGARGQFSRSSLRQFCSYNAVGDGVMSKNRKKKKRNVESYNAKPGIILNFIGVSEKNQREGIERSFF